MTSPTGPDLPDTPIEMTAREAEAAGSSRLRDALVARDVEAIGRALRHDVVVLPLLVDPATGDQQIQVVGIPGDGPDPVGLQLCLFSSGAAYERFIGDAPQRAFALVRGDAVRDALRTHGAALTQVAFDPADDHAMAANPADVLAVLEPQPGDDDVAWLLDGATSPAPARRSRGLFGRRRRDGDAPRA